MADPINKNFIAKSVCMWCKKPMEVGFGQAPKYFHDECLRKQQDLIIKE